MYPTSVIALLSGVIMEAVGIYLISKDDSRLSNFHSRLEPLQRYLLANSLCESLGTEERDKARGLLIQEVYRPQSPEKWWL